MPFATRRGNGRLEVENRCAWLVPEVLRGSLWMIAAAADLDDITWLMPIAARAMARKHVSRFNRLVRTVGLIGTPVAIRGLAPG